MGVRGEPRGSLGYHNIRTCYLLPPTFLFFLLFLSVSLPAISFFNYSLFTLYFLFLYFMRQKTSPDNSSRYVCNSENGLQAREESSDKCVKKYRLCRKYMRFHELNGNKSYATMFLNINNIRCKIYFVANIFKAIYQFWI